MRRRIRAECDSGAGFWPVRAVRAVHADRSGGRRRAKGVSSNSRTSALSEVTAPHAPRCSERLTKIGRKGERERGESVWHRRCGSPDELLLWHCEIQRKNKKKKTKYNSRYSRCRGTTEGVFGRWQQGYGFSPPLHSCLMCTLKEDRTTPPGGWLR